EICGVDEKLAVGDADRQQVGNVVVGHGVAVTLPVDETVNTAQAVGDARRVVGMARQGHQVSSLLGEALERRRAMPFAHVDDGDQPVGKLTVEVVEVAKLASWKERALVSPEAALDVGPSVGVATQRDGSKLVVRRKGEELRIVDRLPPLPAN